MSFCFKYATSSKSVFLPVKIRLATWQLWHIWHYIHIIQKLQNIRKERYPDVLDVWYREDIPTELHYSDNNRIPDIVLNAENHYSILFNKTQWDHFHLMVSHLPWLSVQCPVQDLLDWPGNHKLTWKSFNWPWLFISRANMDGSLQQKTCIQYLWLVVPIS